jgi:hypothetical protein
LKTRKEGRKIQEKSKRKRNRREKCETLYFGGGRKNVIICSKYSKTEPTYAQYYVRRLPGFARLAFLVAVV